MGSRGKSQLGWDNKGVQEKGVDGWRVDEGGKRSRRGRLALSNWAGGRCTEICGGGELGIG